MAYYPFEQFYGNSVAATTTSSVNFEEGDLVEQTSGCSGTSAGKKYIVWHKSGQGLCVGEGSDLCTCQCQWKLVQKHYSSKSKHMEIQSLKEKFVNLFLTEPEKTFRKAGITNGDGLLTQNGGEIFSVWLLKKFGDEFKTAVVDELVKEQEKK